VVQNFPKGIMPNLSDQINEKQMNAIITFIKAQSSLEDNASAQPSVAPPPITKIQESKLDGATLFSSKGCIGCHSLDGSKRVGPSLKGIYQSKQQVVTEGKLHEITVDTAYLHNSIQHPNADVVDGFPSGIMPPFGTTLSNEEVNALVKYLEGV
jgi:cytochrome c oxidase subunit 2